MVEERRGEGEERRGGGRGESICSPVGAESIEQVLILKHGREVVDLDDVGKLFVIDPHILKGRVIILRVLDANVFLCQL